MTLTTQQCILTHLLDCGYIDLEMLEDINYDLDEILDDLVENNDLSLNSIFREVFKQGAKDLKEALDNNRENIENWIKEDIQRWRDAARENVNESNLTEKEIEEEIDNILYGEEEYESFTKYLELLKTNSLSPIEEVDWYCNYQDTSVYMKHLDFYKRYLEEEVENIEDNMGFKFKDC